MAKEKAGYQAPRALRIADKRTVAGDCETGSGDLYCDLVGNSATDQCGSVGNSAAFIGCNTEGNSAVTDCNTGNDFVGH